MHNNLFGRAAELAHLTDLIRTSLSLTDAAIPLLNAQLHVLAEMGIDNLELEGPRIHSRKARWSPAFDDEIPTTFQKSRRVAATVFRWNLPTRPLQHGVAADGAVGPLGRSPKGLFRLVHNRE